MADPEIVIGDGGAKKFPVAQATLVDADPYLSVAEGGSVVSLPTQKSVKLLDPEIKALIEQGFPSGLARAMNTNTASLPLRIWVVDNSGSMNISDGSRLLLSKTEVKVVSCTRWAEMQQTVIYHAELAALLHAPTVFRLLNEPGNGVGNQQFSVAESKLDISRDLGIARSIISNTHPAGVTPLSARLLEIRDNIVQLAPKLRQDGTRVAIIIATDGLPTDRNGSCSTYTKDEFVNALRALEGLPVWVVIRLCTDEKDVVDFYNDLDHQLELSLEVLDDFLQEAKELYKYNKWINYALPLHRCREMGYHHRLFDLMDERKLTKDEVRDYFVFLFGEESMASVPNIHADWKGFLSGTQMLLQRESKQWNPVTKAMGPWIDLKQLNRSFGNGRGCVLM